MQDLGNPSDLTVVGVALTLLVLGLLLAVSVTALCQFLD